MFTLSQQCGVCLLFHAERTQISNVTPTVTQLTFPAKTYVKLSVSMSVKQSTQDIQTSSNPNEKTCVWRAPAVVGVPENKFSRGSPSAKSCATNRLLPLHLCSLVLTSFMHDVPSLTRLCIGHWGGFARSSDFQRVVLCESARIFIVSVEEISQTFT